MIPFVPSDPFPLITNPPYQEEQEHAEKVDHWLGLNIGDVEELLAQKGCRSRARGSLREEQNLWIGLAVKSLLTPYTETRSMLEYL